MFHDGELGETFPPSDPRKSRVQEWEDESEIDRNNNRVGERENGRDAERELIIID